MIPVMGVEVNEKPTARQIFPYSDNGTASYVPARFLANGKSKLDSKFLAVRVEDILKEPDIKPTKLALKRLTNTLEVDIKNAAETRFQLFFTSLLLAWKSKWVFTKCFTEGQAGVKNKISNDNEPELKLVEAHASTNPSLLYTTQEDRLEGLQNPESVKPRIFDKANKNHHLTHKFPNYINQIDLLIDEKTKPNKFLFRSFREVCIEILNYCSNGQMDVAQAFVAFLSNFAFVTHMLSEQSFPEHHCLVLSFYNDTAQRYLAKKEIPAFWRCLSYSHGFDPTQVNALVFENVRAQLVDKVTKDVIVYEKYMELRELVDSYLKDQLGLTHSIHNLDDVVICVLVQNIPLDEREMAIVGAKDDCVQIDSPSVLKYSRSCFVEKSVRLELTQFIRENNDLIFGDGPEEVEWGTTEFGTIVKKHIADNFKVKRVTAINAICLRILFDIEIFSRYRLEGGFLKLCELVNLGPMEIYSRFDMTTATGKHAYACMGDSTIRSKCIELFNSFEI